MSCIIVYRSSIIIAFGWNKAGMFENVETTESTPHPIPLRIGEKRPGGVGKTATNGEQKWVLGGLIA